MTHTTVSIVPYYRSRSIGQSPTLIFSVINTSFDYFECGNTREVTIRNTSHSPIPGFQAGLCILVVYGNLWRPNPMANIAQFLEYSLVNRTVILIVFFTIVENEETVAVKFS